MAFILKYTRLVFTVASLANRRYLSAGRKSLFLEYPKVVSFNKPRTRTAVSVAAEESIETKENDDLEELIHQLNRSVRLKNMQTSEIETVVKALKQRGEITEAQLALLLKCCSEIAFMATNEERVAMAEDLWNFAENSGLKFDITHYNALLVVFVDNNHKFNPEDIFRILENRKIQPNRMTYSLILKAYCQQGDMEGTSQTLEKMKELNYPLSEEDFNSLIQGHCEVGEFFKATELLHVMQTRNLGPRPSSYGKLLCGYAKHGQIEELNKFLNKVIEDKIKIGNPELLEIIYTLAVNKHDAALDTILKNLKLEKDDSVYSSRIIQRLLHKRLDSCALKIFEASISPNLTVENILSRARFVIKHFVTYREPKETLEMCTCMEEKGWTKGAISYALREVLRDKEDVIALRFLNTMRKQGLEIRSHYFYPVVINAAKKGNMWLRRILQKIPRSAFANSYDLTHKVIFPNYRFKNFENDMLYFEGLGINKKLLSFSIFEKALLERNGREAEKIIFTNPVTINQWKHIVNCAVSYLMSEKKSERCFLNILYNYAHDYYYAKMNVQKGEEDELEAQSEFEIFETNETENIFDYAIRVVIKRSKNTELLLNLLEGMRNRKMGITPETAAFIASAINNEDVTEMANKLAAPEAKFELNGNVMRKKFWKINEDAFLNVSDHAKDLVLKKPFAYPEVMEKLGPNASVTDVMFIALVLSKKRLDNEAFKVLEGLLDQKLDLEKAPWTARELFQEIIREFGTHSSKNVMLAFDIGVKLGLSQKNLAKINTILLNRLSVQDSVRIFTKKAERDGKIDGCMRLLVRAAQERNDSAIDRIMTTISGLVNPTLSTNFLVIALATAGQVEKAKRLLDSKQVDLKPRIFYTHCEFFYNNGRRESFENLLKLVQNINNFDRTPLYKVLLQKCASEENIEKAIELCTTIQEDPIPDYDLLKSVRGFLLKPTLDELTELTSNFRRDYNISENSSSTTKSFWATQGEPRLEFQRPHNLLNTAASRGRVSEVLELIKKYRKFNFRRIAESFLRTSKVNEFFEFLEHFISEGKHSQIVPCFNISILRPFLENEAHFEKYKSLAIKCLEEGYTTTPLIALFGNCVKIKNKLPMAEELAKLYNAHFKNIPFFEICEEAKLSGNELEFYKNFISSENLKIYFSDHLHVVYNQLLKHFSKSNDMKDALHYLQMAVSSKNEQYLDKNTLREIEKNLNRNGESFPYPELLTSS